MGKSIRKHKVAMWLRLVNGLIVLLATCIFAADRPGIAYAGFGLVNSHAIIYTGSNTYYYLTQGGSGNGAFQGRDFGEFTHDNTLTLNGAEMIVWDDDPDNIDAGTLFYRIYEQGSSPPGFDSLSIYWREENSNNEKWDSVGNQVNLLPASRPPGRYVIEVYLTYHTSGGVTMYDSRGGSNYQAYFTVVNESRGSGDWDSATWSYGSAPSTCSNGQYVRVRAGDTLTLNSDISVKNLNILGSLNAANRTLTICDGGQFHNQGSFAAGTGTLAFAGVGSVIGTAAFNHVTLLAASTAQGVDFGSSASLNGVLTIHNYHYVSANAPAYADGSTLKYDTGGPFNLSAEWPAGSGAGTAPFHVEVASGNTLNMVADRTARGNVVINGTLNAAAGALYAQGNWVNNGTFNPNGGSVVFDAASDQNASGTLNFYDLTADSGGNTLTFNNNATVGNNLVIENNTTMEMGVYKIGSVGGTLTNNGALVNNETHAVTTGAVTHTYLDSLENTAAEITRNSGDQPGDTTVTTCLGPTIPANAFGSGCAPGPNTVRRYYNITAQDNDGLDVTLRLYYDDGELNSNTEANLKIWHCQNGIWVNQGGVVDATNNYVESTVTGFSPFVLSDDQPTLVLLSSFTATPSGTVILLEWETISEMDHIGFNLYRAETPGGDWVQLNAELILSQNPGSPWGAVYQFVDATITPGAGYEYWLEDINIYGKGTYHGPASVIAPYPSVVELTRLDGSDDRWLGIAGVLGTLILVAGVAWMGRRWIVDSDRDRPRSMPWIRLA